MRQAGPDRQHKTEGGRPPHSPKSAVVLSQNTNRCNTVQWHAASAPTDVSSPVIQVHAKQCGAQGTTCGDNQVCPCTTSCRARACAPPAAALARDRHVPCGPLRLGAPCAPVEELVARDEHAVDDVDDGGAFLSDGDLGGGPSDGDVGGLRQGVRGRKGGRVAGGKAASMSAAAHACRARDARGRGGGRPGTWDQGSTSNSNRKQHQQKAAAAIPAAPAPRAAGEQHSSNTTTNVLPHRDHGLPAGGGLQAYVIHLAVARVLPACPPGLQRRRHSGDWSACGAAFLTLMMHG